MGLETASDLSVLKFAAANEFAIVTKDADFGDLGLARGYPAKIVWLRLGNCTTQAIELVLRRSLSAVIAFEADPNVGVLTLF